MAKRLKMPVPDAPDEQGAVQPGWSPVTPDEMEQILGENPPSTGDAVLCRRLAETLNVIHARLVAVSQEHERIMLALTVALRQHGQLSVDVDAMAKTHQAALAGQRCGVRKDFTPADVYGRRYFVLKYWGPDRPEKGKIWIPG